MFNNSRLKQQCKTLHKDTKGKQESLKNFQNDLKQNKRQEITQYNANLKIYEELYSELMKLSEEKDKLIKKLDNKCLTASEKYKTAVENQTHFYKQAAFSEKKKILREINVMRTENQKMEIEGDKLITNIKLQNSEDQDQIFKIRNFFMQNNETLQLESYKITRKITEITNTLEKIKEADKKDISNLQTRKVIYQNKKLQVDSMKNVSKNLKIDLVDKEKEIFTLRKEFERLTNLEVVNKYDENDLEKKNKHVKDTNHSLKAEICKCDEMISEMTCKKQNEFFSSNKKTTNLLEKVDQEIFDAENILKRVGLVEKQIKQVIHILAKNIETPFVLIKLFEEMSGEYL